jgi:5,10-methylenetetrahydrofolate reductase
MLASSEPKSRILGRGAIDVSFEFFPPKTAAMEETLWRSIRRLDPRAHPRHGRAHPERDDAEARRASHLRRGDQGRGR